MVECMCVGELCLSVGGCVGGGWLGVCGGTVECTHVGGFECVWGGGWVCVYLRDAHPTACS